MNDTSALDPAAIVRKFSEQIAYLSVNPPRAGALFYLLPPCLVLIAIDVSTRLSKRPKIAIENAESAAKEKEVEELVHRVQDALTKFRALEKRLSTEKARSQHLARMLRKQQNFTMRRQHLSTLKSPAEEGFSPKAITAPPLPKISHVRSPFHAFCERLILQNRIWAQQREVKKLQERLTTMKHSSRTDAFRAFCERLVMSNKIWAQQEAVSRLLSEAEALKRSRQHVVTRAAEKMALDVEKERLTEDFVKDLLSEADACQRALITLRADHEQEVQELAQDWREECRQLSREVKRLELSRDAGLVEQDLSNDQERELLERLNCVEEETLVLDVIDEAAEDHHLADVPEEMQDAETYSESELERISNMSTSTCVASAGIRTPARKDSFSETPSRSRTKSLNKQQPVPLPPLKLISRRPSMSIILSPSASSSSANSPVRKLEAGPYAGFSFNPRFFGNSSNTSPGEPSDSGSSVRVRTYSLQSPAPHDRMRTYSLQSERGGSTSSYSNMVGGAREPPKRAQWRL